MTATVPPPKKQSYDPDDFRMTIGEHLEELRHRIILALAGVVVGIIFCIPLAKQIMAIICRPLVMALQSHNLNPQLFADDTTEVFMSWVEVTLIAAGSLAGPWLIYQLWQFIASGLYPQERKSITRYVPLAVTLLLAGMAFVYFIVLPLTMNFFVAFTNSIPLELGTMNAPPIVTNSAESHLQVVTADPPHPTEGQIWLNVREGRPKVFLGGSVRSLLFGGDSLMTPHFKLGDYLDLVFRLLITFGLCFQLPLVVMAVARLGIVEISQLKAWRRQVYFGMTVLAATVSPGDVVTATLALLAPLILLYEFGIFLAWWNVRQQKSAAAR
ncbi:MAG: twin-arginine translocase subunit TatC [Tepidisphaeraceae bacterium]|jgi:sec-independent protein translocase protein TatC